MPRVPSIDRLLRWLFGIARRVFLLQGLAFGCASAASVAWVSTHASPWMTRALYSLNERDSNRRGRRSTLVGGVLLLAIGALVSYRVSIDQPRT